MKNTLDIMAEWENLNEHAKCECIFGEPLDVDLFTECMRDAAGFFPPEKLKNDSFNSTDLDLYGLILAYSLLPVVEESENNELFEASLLAANGLAMAVSGCEAKVFEERKMSRVYEIDGVRKTAVYDFETGDLGGYIEFERDYKSDYDTFTEINILPED